MPSWPAGRGIPLLPVEVDDGGVVEGSPRLLGRSVLDWYRYCGHRETPGLQPGYEPATEALVYAEGERSDPWYGEKVGEPARVEHFDEPPTGAPVTWRSQGKEGKDVVTAVLLRLDPDAVHAEGVERALVAQAGLSEGFLAFVTFCTHYCCVPGWKHAPEQAKVRDAWDDIFCTCCFSRFDPRTITAQEYVLPAEGA